MSEKIRPYLFYITLFLFILLVSFQSNMADYDLFARLLQGQAFWNLGNILHHDIFSYTPTHTWFDHEWGASVVFYGIFAKFSAFGLLFLKALMIFAIFFLVIETVKLRGLQVGNSPYNFLFYFFAYHAAAQSGFIGAIRCQLFTYLFFVIWLYILERVRVRGEYYLLITFVPMMLFWSNIHGGCVAGLGLLVLYALGELFNRKPFKYYIFTIIGCILIMFANPWGVAYVKFLAMAATMSRKLIIEWQPTFGGLNTGNYIVFKSFLVAIALGVFAGFLMCFNKIKLKTLDWTKLIIIMVMTYLSLRYTRHQPFFVICAVVFLYDDIYFVLSRVTKKIIKSDLVMSKLFLWKEVLIFIFVAIATLSYFVVNKPQIVVDNYKFPVKPIEFIRKNKLAGNLLVNFHYGSYAAYKLYPSNLIAMDGRYEEVYPDYMLPMFNNFFMQVGDNPNMLIDMFRPDVIVVEHEFEADKSLSRDKTYKKAYSDENYSVYVDKKISKKVYLQPEEDIKYYNDTLFDSRLKFTKVRKSK